MAYVKERIGRRKVGGRNVKYWDARWDVYVGGKRKERSKTFTREGDAKRFLTTIGVRKPSSSDPVKALTAAFLEEYERAVDAGQREKSTLRQLRYHVEHHILADGELGELKCEEVATPEVQRFLDRLYAREGVSVVMAGKVRTTLSQIFSFGARRGFVQANPVRDSKLAITARPQAGEDGGPFVLPEKAKLLRLVAAARAFDNTGKAEAVVRTWMYAGLRCSELRGLPRRKLLFDISQPKLRVDQKADENNEIGRVKAQLSRRDVPLGPETVSSLKRWLDAAPEGEFVFANADGKVWSYSNLWNRFWVPLMNMAGLVKDDLASDTVRGLKDREPKPKAPKISEGPPKRLSPSALRRKVEVEKRKLERTAKREAKAALKQPEFNPHVLRHVFASLQIEQGIQPKRLQALMGHATLKVTMDTYGHLWPDEEGDQLAARVENALG